MSLTTTEALYRWQIHAAQLEKDGLLDSHLHDAIPATVEAITIQLQAIQAFIHLMVQYSDAHTQSILTDLYNELLQIAISGTTADQGLLSLSGVVNTCYPA